jgi:NAD(P)H-hydrate epimerase
VKIVSVAQMRSLEASAFAAGVSEAALQEQAGTAVAEEVGALLAPGESVVVLAGHGNNGRDGAIAARLLAQRGTRVEVFLGPRHAIRSDELDVLRALGVRVGAIDQRAEMVSSLQRARIALDALVGIGATGALREPLGSCVHSLNAVSATRGAELQVVGLDIPSGIDADTGDVPGEAVWADHTVTLGAVKQGLLRFPAAERVGRLVVRDIGIPAAAAASLPYALLEERSLAKGVPPRPLDAHKYRFGRVLVVAGAPHFLGAPTLCAAAAARAGAGLVTVASTTAVRHAVATHVPEVTYVEQDLEPDSEPDRSIEVLLPRLGERVALVVGPGLGRSNGTVRFVRQLLEARAQSTTHRAGVVIDGDALYALAEWPGWWERIGPDAVLTPHSGELARLTGAENGPPGASAWEQAGRFAQRWQCVLVAKGPFTCVGGPDGQVEVWSWANPALATAGTGDVLAGLCGGLLAQGASPWDAARVAVAVHARAALAVQDRNGWRTVLASDLLPQIPAQLGHLADARAGRPTPRED